MIIIRWVLPGYLPAVALPGRNRGLSWWERERWEVPPGRVEVLLSVRMVIRPSWVGILIIPTPVLHGYIFIYHLLQL
jgi:hypothetical protein